MRDEEDAESKLRRLRGMYEPYMSALSGYLFMPLPEWRASEGARDNWRGLA